MTGSERHNWLRAAALTGLVYVVVGLVASALARSASSVHVGTVWWLAAWSISAVAFATHIGYERRFRQTAPSTALRVSAGVALATFVLATTAVIRQLTGSPFRGRMLLAFAVWPLLTGVVSFLVALAVVAVLTRLTRRAPEAAP